MGNRQIKRILDYYKDKAQQQIDEILDKISLR
jgi:ribosomal protein S15P/S13E